MKFLAKLYDKLILGIVTLTLAIVAILSFLDSGETDPEIKNTQINVKEKPYVNLNSNDDISEKLTWTDVQAQGEGDTWKFDVFTPPVIYVVKGEFTELRPEDALKKGDIDIIIIPFGVKLTSIDRETFPFVLESYSGDIKNPKITIFNTKSEVTYRKKTGETITEENIKVISFNEKREKIEDETGLRFVTVATLIIKDLKGNKEYTLDNEKKALYTGNTVVTVRNETNPQETVSFNQDAKGFKIGINKYNITKLDLENKQLSVEKTNPQEDETIFKMTLDISSDTTDENTEESTNDTPPANAGGDFGDLF